MEKQPADLFLLAFFFMILSFRLVLFNIEPLAGFYRKNSAFQRFGVNILMKTMIYCL